MHIPFLSPVAGLALDGLALDGLALVGLALVGLPLGAVALSGLSLVAAVEPLQTGAVEPGDQVAYTFRSEFLGDPGPGSLVDLRGKPVLIDFWGTR